MTAALAQSQTQEVKTAPAAGRARLEGVPTEPFLGNQARLRRLAVQDDPAREPPPLVRRSASPATLRRLVAAPSAADATEVAGHVNSFCAGSATATGSNVTAVTAKCATPAGPGCVCACKAMQDPARTYDIAPLSCNVKMASETIMPGGTTQSIPESSVWPNTSGPNCGTPIPIEIPRSGGAMEFGAFKADGSPFWYDTGRIMAHELCGHGVGCQTYAGGTGNRPQHDVTIDTENAIAAPPVRGHFADRPPPPGKARQGEAFTNKVGDRSKVAFKLTDGWHYEVP